MGGAPLSFAGKGTFLQDHGYTQVHGREEWAHAGATPDEFNVWGLYDSNLLQRAKTRRSALHAAGQPFNLTLSTLDMHHPHGFMSPACRQRGAGARPDQRPSVSLLGLNGSERYRALWSPGS